MVWGWLALAGVAAWALASQGSSPDASAQRDIIMAKVVIPPVKLPARVQYKVVNARPILTATVRSVMRPLTFVPMPAIFGFSESLVSEVPIYSEMPPMPPGYKAVRVWGPSLSNDGKGWEPRPDRFRQWRPLHSNKSWEDYSKWFQDEYWFGVVDNADQLEFYVVGKSSVGLCCAEAERALYSVTGSGVQRQGHAGGVSSPWKCTKLAPECFDLLKRPAWPQVPRIGEDWRPLLRS